MTCAFVNVPGVHLLVTACAHPPIRSTAFIIGILTALFRPTNTITPSSLTISLTSPHALLKDGRVCSTLMMSILARRPAR